MFEWNLLRSEDDTINIKSFDRYCDLNYFQIKILLNKFYKLLIKEDVYI